MDDLISYCLLNRAAGTWSTMLQNLQKQTHQGINTNVNLTHFQKKWVGWLGAWHESMIKKKKNQFLLVLANVIHNLQCKNSDIQKIQNFKRLCFFVCCKFEKPSKIWKLWHQQMEERELVQIFCDGQRGRKTEEGELPIFRVRWKFNKNAKYVGLNYISSFNAQKIECHEW